MELTFTYFSVEKATAGGTNKIRFRHVDPFETGEEFFLIVLVFPGKVGPHLPPSGVYRVFGEQLPTTPLNVSQTKDHFEKPFSG